MTRQSVKSINRLFDELLSAHDLVSDAALAKFLQLSPSVICRLRAGGKISPHVILHIHEKAGISVKDIRAMIG